MRGGEGLNQLDPYMQRGFRHAMHGYPYLYRMEHEPLTDRQLEQYARGYVLAKPEGRAAYWHAMPHNREPASRDARDDKSFLAFLGVILKVFA